ncbi:MAG: right-handed parallel beta-helix repeat-containing protein, partial [Gaiellales bacterium]
MAALVQLGCCCVLAASAEADSLYVDPGNSACSDGASLAIASNPATPWCSAGPATRLARPGDVIHLAAARYPALRPATSGTPAQPIVYVGDAGATIAPAPAAVGVMVVGVHDLVLRGMRIVASANQGVAIDNAQNILLDHDTVTNSGGSGVWIKHGSAVTMTSSALVGNARAGLVDSQYASGTRLIGSTVSGNGIDGKQYGGDGVELDGANEAVRSSTISGNGDGIGFEHGIYVGQTATDYSITGNRISGNAGADIKATGGAGVIAYNTLGSGMWGLVLSDNSTLVTVEYNLVQGRFQHGIFLTTGTTAARARLLNNTVEQT